jgi:hypothetical protein
MEDNSMQALQWFIQQQHHYGNKMEEENVIWHVVSKYQLPGNISTQILKWDLMWKMDYHVNYFETNDAAYKNMSELEYNVSWTNFCIHMVVLIH